MPTEPILRAIPWDQRAEEQAVRDTQAQIQDQIAAMTSFVMGGADYDKTEFVDPYAHLMVGTSRTTGIRERLVKADGTSADPQARLASALQRRAEKLKEWRECMRVMVRMDELIEALERECDCRDTEPCPTP